MPENKRGECSHTNTQSGQSRRWRMPRSTMYVFFSESYSWNGYVCSGKEIRQRLSLLCIGLYLKKPEENVLTPIHNHDDGGCHVRQCILYVFFSESNSWNGYMCSGKGILPPWSLLLVLVLCLKRKRRVLLLSHQHNYDDGAWRHVR